MIIQIYLSTKSFALMMNAKSTNIKSLTRCCHILRKLNSFDSSDEQLSWSRDYWTTPSETFCYVCVLSVKASREYIQKVNRTFIASHHSKEKELQGNCKLIFDVPNTLFFRKVCVKFEQPACYRCRHKTRKIFFRKSSISLRIRLSHPNESFAILPLTPIQQCSVTVNWTNPKCQQCQKYTLLSKTRKH